MNDLRNFITNRLTWVTAAIVVAFITAAKTAPETSIAEVMRASIMALSFMAFVGYVSEAVSAYKAHRWPNDPLMAALGNCILFAGIGFSAMFQTVWRLSKDQNYIVTNDYYSFTMMMQALGILILVILPRFLSNWRPANRRRLFAVLWVCIVGGVVWLTVASPDLTWLSIWLKPWLIQI